MELKKELTDLLIGTLTELIKKGSNNTFWGTTRANSDAIIALTACLPEFDYYKLRSKCIDKIANEGNVSDEFINWHEEVWDTSIAIMALSTDYENNKSLIIKGLNWIESKYIKVNHSWNEELWETLLALNAITYSRSKTIRNNNNTKYFVGSINWINSLYNTPQKGILINWSSTALYLLFAVNSKKFELDLTNRDTLNNHIKLSSEQILQSNINLSDSVLWTSEMWSNALVLWAISESRCGTLTDDRVERIIIWFRERISLKETPIEDKAFACVGLYKYLEYMESMEVEEKISPSLSKERLQNKLSKLINLRVKDYIPKPPLLDKNYHSNYYTIVLKKRIINIMFIFLITFLLTYFSILASIEYDNVSEWLSIIPVIIGLLATVSQLTNFNFFQKKVKKRYDQ